MAAEILGLGLESRFSRLGLSGHIAPPLSDVAETAPIRLRLRFCQPRSGRRPASYLYRHFKFSNPGTRREWPCDGFPIPRVPLPSAVEHLGRTGPSATFSTCRWNTDPAGNPGGSPPSPPTLAAPERGSRPTAPPPCPFVTKWRCDWYCHRSSPAMPPGRGCL